MTTNQPQRYGGLLGVVGGALLLGGAAIMATLSFMPSEADALASLTDDTGRILGGAQILIIGGVLVAAFGAVLQRRIRSAAPDSPLGSAVAMGYGLTGLLAMLSIIGFVGGALRIDEQGSITAGQAATMVDFSMLVLGGVAPATLALGVGAASIAALRFDGVLPRWLGWVGAPITIGLLVLPINYVFGPIGVLWTIAAGVVMSSTGTEVVDVSRPDRQRVAV